MSTKECQASDPATCRHHGPPLATMEEAARRGDYAAYEKARAEYDDAAKSKVVEGLLELADKPTFIGTSVPVRSGSSTGHQGLISSGDWGTEEEALLTIPRTDDYDITSTYQLTSNGEAYEVDAVWVADPANGLNASDPDQLRYNDYDALGGGSPKYLFGEDTHAWEVNVNNQHRDVFNSGEDEKRDAATAELHERIARETGWELSEVRAAVHVNHRYEGEAFTYDDFVNDYTDWYENHRHYDED